MDHHDDETGTAEAYEASEPEAEPTTREQRRSRRKRAVRARTISVKRMTKRDLELGALLNPETDETRALRAQRPVTRADCEGGVRPCPWVSCAHNLYLDVQPRTAAIKLNFPDLEPDQMTHSCALDIADRGGETLEFVGEAMSLTRERVRQLEVRVFAKVHADMEMVALRDFVDEGPVLGKRRVHLKLVASEPESEPEGEDWDLGDIES
jgi:hypothetical protein